ncbi:MAG: hypothetical protein RLZZ292_766, partial [Bacteroidota bacterium]
AKSESEKAKSESEKAKSESEKAKSESEKAKSENEKAKSENLMIKIRSIINLKDKMNLTIEQIASILEYEVDFVTEVLSKYQND